MRTQNRPAAEGREYATNIIEQLAVGLGASCVLLALACTQMWNREGAAVRYDIDNAGVLQLTWLVGDEPHLRDVVKPTETELRKAGMFDIHMGELLLAKSGQSSKSDTQLASLARYEDEG